MKNSHLTPDKLIQKVSQVISSPMCMPINILKVYQNLTLENWSFSRWHPRWSPNLQKQAYIPSNSVKLHHVTYQTVRNNI